LKFFFINIIILLLNILGRTHPSHLGWAEMDPTRLSRIGMTSGLRAFSPFIFSRLGWNGSNPWPTWSLALPSNHVNYFSRCMQNEFCMQRPQGGRRKEEEEERKRLPGAKERSCWWRSEWLACLSSCWSYSWCCCWELLHGWRGWNWRWWQLLSLPEGRWVGGGG